MGELNDWLILIVVTAIALYYLRATINPNISKCGEIALNGIEGNIHPVLLPNTKGSTEMVTVTNVDGYVGLVSFRATANNSLVTTKHKINLNAARHYARGQHPIHLNGFVDKKRSKAFLIIVDNKLDMTLIDSETFNVVWQSTIPFTKVIPTFVNSLFTSKPMRVNENGAIIIVVTGTPEDLDSYDEDPDEAVAVFSFDLDTGALRWHYFAADWEKRLNDEVVDDHRLDHIVFGNEHSKKAHILAQVDHKHKDPQDWRSLKKSFLDSLPHRWDDLSDTSMSLVRLEASKVGRNKNEGSWSADSIGLRESHHLVSPTKPDKKIVEKPNGVMIRWRHGLQALHLWTGRPIAHISVSPYQLLIDINNDHEIEATFVDIGTESESRDDDGEEGIHTPYQLVTVSLNSRVILQYDIPFPRDVGHENTFAEDNQYRDAVTPLYAKSARSKWGAYIVFTNDGIVTAIDPKGHLSWQVQTSCEWNRDEGDERAPASMATHSTQDWVVLVGSDSICIVDFVWGSIVLQEPLVNSGEAYDALTLLTFGDVNGDTVDDIIITKGNSITVFSVMGQTIYKNRVELIVQALAILILTLLCVIVVYKLLVPNSKRE